jgi:hypothetical protein
MFLGNKTIFNDDETNKTVLSKAANILIVISILGCILAISDYHSDLNSYTSTFTQSYGVGMFFLLFNWIVVIGNGCYIVLSVYRYFTFTQQKNEEVIKKLSFKEKPDEAVKN